MSRISPRKRWGHDNEIEDLIQRLTELRASGGRIEAGEAEALIADDDELFGAVALYTSHNPNVFEEWPEMRGRLVAILRRIRPFTPYFKAFYRGQEEPGCGPDEVLARRGFRSWTANRRVAEDFARDYADGVVCVLSRPVRGVSIEGIATWRMRVRDESQYPGMQAEWLILDE